jgi:hypothetical protein
MNIAEIATEWWPVALVALGAILAVLKVVAPKTKTQVDDKAVDILEKVVDLTDGKDDE